MMDFNNDFEYDNTDFLRFVKEIIKMPYLNRQTICIATIEK